MGKLKGGKKIKAGSNFSSGQSRKPPNPFEEKIIKEKQQIFGQSQKNAKGKPGVSRTQACLKRKYTLLHEYEQQHKSNSISDYRIGEKNRFISQEDKTVARYAAVRAKHKSKQLYNLESNYLEVLTHNGQTLNEIEKFEDPRSDDDDSDDGNVTYGGGTLDKQFVSNAHFGGGILSRKVNTGNEGHKSYKDIISQLITDSKKRKVEKQREKECTQELTDKLDSEWKDLLPLMTNKQSKAVVEEQPSSDICTVVDKYDRYVKELRFEARGVPSDKLKTSTEIAAEVAKTREILERERLARMQGPCFSNPTPVHRSADDLFDNCTAYNTGTDEENVVLGYNDDGVLMINGSAIVKESEANMEDRMSVIEEELANQQESSEDEQDNFSDLQSDDDDSDSNSAKEDLFNKQQPPKPIEQPQFSVKPITINSFPKTYEDFKQIFRNSTYSEYDLNLNHLMQYAKTTPNRKDDISFLLTSLLRYIRDEDHMNVYGHLIPGVYQLVQVDPQTACNTFVEILQEIWTEYKSRKKGLSVGALLWFKVVASVFSVSDFRHAVATPALLILEEMLGQAAVRIRSARDVASGLFLAALMMEFTCISKRFSPALLQFLTTIIRCATKSQKLNDKWHKIWKVTKDILLLTNNNGTITSFPLKIDVSYLKNENKIISDDFKITSVYVTLKLLQAAYRQLQTNDLPSRCEVFATVRCAVNDICNDGSRCLYPSDVRMELDNFVQMIKQDAAGRHLEHLTVEKKRPKPLRLYEPNIQTIYDRKVRGSKGDSKNERDKLLYKLKQERKGALREIRKDVTFLGRHRIRHQIKSDEERKANVKKIFADAAIQQSDLNSLKRKKNS